MNVENWPIIRNQLSSKDLFDAFKIQLAKDFEQSNFPSDFVAALEPDHGTIYKKISFELQRSSSRADANIMQLVYRIDISEAQLKKYLGKSSDDNYFNVIAELIIRRVLQKVVIRQYYKNSTSS